MPFYSPRQNNEESSCVTPLSDSEQPLAEKLNNALKIGGEGYILQLCAGQQYYIDAPIVLTFPDQEVSTEGYPSGDQRATIIVNGTETHTIAIQANCDACSGIKLRNIKINGSKNDSHSMSSGNNIEIGGNTSNQLVKQVASYSTRGWTCLHVSEGSTQGCKNATIVDNDIGPCGVEDNQRWADGVSVSCRNSVIKNNIVTDATDGGISINGAPGTEAANNTVQAKNYTARAGIKMVSYLPYNGDYSGTTVYDNTVIGGFSNEIQSEGAETGTNSQHVIVKIGIAIGPRIWAGSLFTSTTQVSAGVIRDNHFTGAVAYALAVASAEDFVISNNEMTGRYAFIGDKNTSCTDSIPSPGPFLVDTQSTNILDVTQQGGIEEFQFQDGDDLVNCIIPPDGTLALWPFPPSTAETTDYSGAAETVLPVHIRTTEEKIGMGVGIPLATIVFFFAIWFIRRWAIKNQIARRVSQRFSQVSNRLSTLLA